VTVGHSSPSRLSRQATTAPLIALVGNTNVGKSTLFNQLSGAHRDIDNWPGTTVEVGRAPA
jgi:ferrous iron transport protein B